MRSSLISCTRVLLWERGKCTSCVRRFVKVLFFFCTIFLELSTFCTNNYYLLLFDYLMHILFITLGKRNTLCRIQCSTSKKSSYCLRGHSRSILRFARIVQVCLNEHFIHTVLFYPLLTFVSTIVTFSSLFLSSVRSVCVRSVRSFFQFFRFFRFVVFVFVRR